MALNVLRSLARIFPEAALRNVSKPLIGMHPISLYDFSTSGPLQMLQKQSRLRVVDNSAIGQQARAAGKPCTVIHVYTKLNAHRRSRAIGVLGDKVMVAIMGQKKRGYIVGVSRAQKPMIPATDTNNIVLIDDNGAPLGTRINVPIPMMLRSKPGDISKIFAIATRFV